ncbi:MULTISPECIES: hypothetical protein [Rhizobium]|uniref:hypothetical protein n=1 Tax=Rhizobium TaxID=379 RepID=UPI00195B9C21|nr:MULTISPECIES: hypothetical protein [Rhizobium]MBM7048677.1 hypothetical protein [Rhizobium lusitanum]
MGSDKERLDVDSESWTGIGFAENNLGKTEKSEFSLRNVFSFKRVLDFTLVLTASQMLLQAAFHVIYQLIYGNLSLNVQAIASDPFFSGSDFSYHLKIGLNVCGAIILIKTILFLIRATSRFLQKS